MNNFLYDRINNLKLQKDHDYYFQWYKCDLDVDVMNSTLIFHHDYALMNMESCHHDLLIYVKKNLDNEDCIHHDDVIVDDDNEMDEYGVYDHNENYD